MSRRAICRRKVSIGLLIVFFWIVFWTLPLYATDSIRALEKYPKSALLIVDPQENISHSRNPDLPLVPASTIKVLTGLIALEHWGRDHRFATDLFLDSEQKLWVKGYGDPYLISEEIERLAKTLAQAGVLQVSGIGVDASYFSDDIVVQGQSASSNPYDAPLGAVAANFNTINVKVTKSGGVASAEGQTPLTPLAKSLSSALGYGVHRVNLGSSHHVARYFSELLVEKLRAAGVQAVSDFEFAAVPQGAEFILKYRSQRTLEDVVAAMLKYSNNFIANQLYLGLGANIYGSPATMNKSRKVVDHYIEQYFDWSDYALYEGAGLSRQNRLSARQLIDVLKRFAPYRSLMPKQEQQILAKSGTLKGVSTYAGYVYREDNWLPFSLLINQGVPYRFRERLASDLLVD